MNGKEFRANAAGYLDASSTLVRSVVDTFKAGEAMKDETGRRKKLECPPAIYEELAKADAHLQRVSAWLLDDSFGMDS